MVEQEFIRCLHINAKSLELIPRKVFDVERDNDIRPTLNGSREDMRVIRIWQETTLSSTSQSVILASSKKPRITAIRRSTDSGESSG